MKTVKIQVRWAAAHPGQDRRLPSVVAHSRLQRATARSRVGIVSSKTAPGSLSTGSPAGRTPLLKKATRRLNVQSSLRKGRWRCGRQARAQLSVIVDTERVSAGSGWAR